MKDTRKKICTAQELAMEIPSLQLQGLKVVFTNGCFDLIHPGHVRYLQAARRLGDLLVVALNSDHSVRRLKGPDRPIQPASDRQEILAALDCVDRVVLFEEETPLNLIRQIKPDILVKGGDWPKEKIVGREVVEERGGQVVSIDFQEGYSTSRIIERIRRGNRRC